MNRETQSIRPNSSSDPGVTGWLQRKCACGNHTSGGGGCESCRRNASTPNVSTSVGAPLDAATRAFFEPRFGHDFSSVRVHADRHAAESARMLNAQAFAVGQDLVFAGGQYAPTTEPGKRLLAHELTHVVQQANSNNAVQTKSLFSSSSDRAEQEATRVADRVVAGERVAVTQQPAALVQGNGWLGAGIGALSGGLIGLLAGGPIGGLVGLGVGALVGGLNWLARRPRSERRPAESVRWPAGSRSSASGLSRACGCRKSPGRRDHGAGSPAKQLRVLRAKVARPVRHPGSSTG